MIRSDIVTRIVVDATAAKQGAAEAGAAVDKFTLRAAASGVAITQWASILTTAGKKLEEWTARADEFENVAGNLVGSIDAAKTATAGLIPTLDLMRAKNQVMNENIRITENDFRNMAAAAQNLSDRGFGPATEILKKFTDGVAKGTTEELRKFIPTLQATGSSVRDVSALLDTLAESQLSNAKEAVGVADAMGRAKNSVNDFFTMLTTWVNGSAPIARFFSNLADDFDAIVKAEKIAESNRAFLAYSETQGKQIEAQIEQLTTRRDFALREATVAAQFENQADYSFASTEVRRLNQQIIDLAERKKRLRFEFDAMESFKGGDDARSLTDKKAKPSTAAAAKRVKSPRSKSVAGDPFETVGRGGRPGDTAISQLLGEAAASEQAERNRAARVEETTATMRQFEAQLALADAYAVSAAEAQASAEATQLFAEMTEGAFVGLGQFTVALAQGDGGTFLRAQAARQKGLAAENAAMAITSGARALWEYGWGNIAGGAYFSKAAATFAIAAAMHGAAGVGIGALAGSAPPAGGGSRTGAGGGSRAGSSSSGRAAGYGSQNSGPQTVVNNFNLSGFVGDEAKLARELQRVMSVGAAAGSIRTGTDANGRAVPLVGG